MHARSFVLSGLLLLVTAVAADAQTPRFAYIDSQAILQEAPGASDAQREFEEELESYQEEVEQMGREMERLIADYQQQQGNMSQEARDSREEEIRRREAEYQQRVEALETQADQRRRELVEPILNRMSQTIEDIRAEGGYTMIFDVASQAIIAADPELDLTTQVIERLRADAEVEDR